MTRFLIILILGIIFTVAGIMSAIITLIKSKGQKANAIASIAFVLAGLLLIMAYFFV